MAASRGDGWFSILTRAPWQAGVVAGVVAFVIIDQALPVLVAGLIQRSLPAAHAAAPHISFRYFALIVMALCFVAAGVSFHGRHQRKALLAAQRDLATLRSLSWQNFERLVGEAFRGQGYIVTETGQGGADGGIDLELKKGGLIDLVQCKHWKRSSVGAAIVREMYGLLFHRKASRVKIITSGNFTREARRFAIGKPIDLIDGPLLVSLVQSVRRGETPQSPLTPPAAVPNCPSCGSPMVRRTARQTQEQFWGCSRFPSCRGTRILAD